MDEHALVLNSLLVPSIRISRLALRARHPLGFPVDSQSIVKWAISNPWFACACQLRGSDSSAP
jgi:hypothetical protein